MGSFWASAVVLVCLVSFTASFPLELRSYGGGESVGNSLPGEETMRWLFEEWMVSYDKSYRTTQEKERRFEIFRDNTRFIYEHNNPRNNHSYVVGLNNLADLTNEEYRSRYLGKPFNMSELISGPISARYRVRRGDQIPDSIDWRSSGAVGPVKDQGSCPSCWAFSAVATVEGLNKIVNGELVTLSEQELVDCERGCRRSYPHIAYRYIMSNGGIDTDESYPYVSQDGVRRQCRADKDKVVSIDRYEYGPIDSEAAIANAVANQPVSVAVQSRSRGFQLYRKGIISADCGNNIDHAVTIVGYDATDSMDYWIVKNSWSEGWGEDGYVRIQRNAPVYKGMCGIAGYFSYPVIEGFAVGHSA